MANNDLAIIERPQAKLSLPRHLAWLSDCLGTSQWPGEEVVYTLPSKVTVSDAERQFAQAHLDEIRLAMSPSHPSPAVCSRARLSLLTKLLMGYSVGGGSDEAATARIEMYLDAVGDVPPWAINAAIKRWNRMKCGGLGFAPNYSFAPSPAHLRAVCEDELAGCRETAAKLERLLRAVPIAEATRTHEWKGHVAEKLEEYRRHPANNGPLGGHAKRVMDELERHRESLQAANARERDGQHSRREAGLNEGQSDDAHR